MTLLHNIKNQLKILGRSADLKTGGGFHGHSRHSRAPRVPGCVLKLAGSLVADRPLGDIAQVLKGRFLSAASVYPREGGSLGTIALVCGLDLQPARLFNYHIRLLKAHFLRLDFPSHTQFHRATAIIPTRRPVSNRDQHLSSFEPTVIPDTNAVEYHSGKRLSTLSTNPKPHYLQSFPKYLS